MAGGTGGHVFPGLAVAEQLRRQGVKVLWMGTRKGLEARVVPSANIEIEWIMIEGLRRRGWIGWAALPWRLLRAMWQSWRILRRCRPDAVLAMGGFVAGPGALTAWLMRRPLLIHEQNAVPGLTNRLLAVIADYVLCGFPRTFANLPGSRHVGNPVRPAIARLPEPQTRLAGRHGPLRLLVIGGSLGARVFNEIVPAACAHFAAHEFPEIWHQTGAPGLQAAVEAYGQTPAAVKVTAFIEDMAEAYAWADVVLCRAGAMTVAELAVAGVAAILVPYPYAVDDHQTVNAGYLVEHEAAVMVPQSELTAARLADMLGDLRDNREALLKMAVNARGCAMPDAADTVAGLCLEAMHA